MSVACAVLAAGGSSRLGAPKQLLVLDGKPLVQRAVEAACASRCEHVAVVLGAHATDVARALGVTRASTLHNASWSSAGMASSMHVAVHWAERIGAAALLLCVCDQPHLSAAQLDLLVAAYEAQGRCVASRYGGVLGVPALIPARHFPELLAIEGDRGAAALLRSSIDVGAVDWPAGAVDLDTTSDVASFCAATAALLT